MFRIAKFQKNPLQEAGTPPPGEDTESSCPLSPASLEIPLTPIKKIEEKAVNEERR